MAFSGIYNIRLYLNGLLSVQSLKERRRDHFLSYFAMHLECVAMHKYLKDLRRMKEG